MRRYLAEIRGLARRLASRTRAGGLVLMYHRVADVGSDPWALCVTPSHFEEHLQLLRERFRVVPLARLAEAIGANGSSRPPVAVTFDDGYADNLHAAKPLLERYDVPATVFVTAGCLGAPREFWWDELERTLLSPGSLPAGLELVLEGRRREWRLDGAETYTDEDSRQHRRWTVYDRVDPTPRHTLFRELYSELYELAPQRRIQVLDALLAWAGSAPSVRPSHRTLTPSELAELAGGHLVEIGAHTMTHPPLDSLSRGEQWEEISGSRTRLEELAGQTVTTFAYPHGAFSSETIDLVRDAGFSFACSTRYAAVSRDCDPYRLPRVEVRDGDGDSLARHLPF